MGIKKIKIEIEVSKRIFCFYALLNYFGYKPKKKPHPLREIVIKYLDRVLANSDLKKSQEFLYRDRLKKEFWFSLRTWVLCHGEPPAFKETSPHWRRFLDKNDAERFEKLIRDFYKTAKIVQLWQRVKPQYIKIKKSTIDSAKKSIESSLSYLKLSAADVDFDKFVVIPNFLDEYNRGIGPKINGVAYAILGPSKGQKIFPVPRIQHEFLHSVINPITQKILGNETLKSELSFIRESIINAIVLRINKSDSQYYQKKMRLLKQSKFKDIEKFIDFLEQYENQTEDFTTFFSKNRV